MIDVRAPFSFWLTNFGWFAQGRSAATFDEARQVAKDIGFEVSVYDADEELVAFWSPIGGWRESRRAV